MKTVLKILKFKKIINQLEKNLLHAKEMKTQKIENDECHKKITQLEKNVYDSKISQNYLQAQINSQTSELSMLKKKVEDDKVIQKQQKEMIDDLKKKERIRDENAKFQAIVKNIENKLEEKNKYTKKFRKRL